jgi:hypothetical protein
MEGEGIEPKLNAERYRWIKQQLGTDLLNLDEEVSRIGQLVQDVGENAALANELRDAAKENLEVVSAREISILRNDVKPGDKAKTDTKVWEEVRLVPAHAEAQALLGDARLDSALWKSLENAVDRKSYSLQSAVSLITAGYLTMDTILAKRRKDIRNVRPQSVPTEEAK